MTLEDPFFVVKDDVLKAIARTKDLFERWFELNRDGIDQHVVLNSIVGSVAKEELDWVSTELRNSLRSIEWDLEDLDETIAIVEKNPKKFKIEVGDLTDRRSFIQKTREDIKRMKDTMSLSKSRDRQSRQPLLSSNALGLQSSNTNANGGGKYKRLHDDIDSPDHTKYVSNNMDQQAVLTRQQDDQLDLIRDSMGTLKNMSSQIGTELDEQAIMLDDFGHEIEMTESKMDAAMKKVAKVLGMSNDRRQWIAIGVLSGIIIVIIILLSIL